MKEIYSRVRSVGVQQKVREETSITLRSSPARTIGSSLRKDNSLAVNYDGVVYERMDLRAYIPRNCSPSIKSTSNIVELVGLYGDINFGLFICFCLFSL